MRRSLIILVWLVVFIIDGVVLPALSGWPSGFGIIVLLSALAITFGIHRWVIGLGLVLAGLTELVVGAYFGTVIGAWLIMAWSWYISNHFLNMKSVSENDSLVALAPFTILGLGLFILGEFSLWVISRLVYQTGLSITTLTDMLRSPTIMAIVIIELVVTIFVFRFIYSAQND